jgi:hypothetical protein
MISLAIIRNAAQAGRIKWRHHALLRADERGITREQAIQVMQEGEILEQRPRAKPYPKCLMMRRGEENRPLYVSLGYNQENDFLYVITVHWLDPEKWDDPWTRKIKPS